jgi:ribonuclease III
MKIDRDTHIIGDILMHELLEEALGVHFQNSAHIRLALTHRSYIYEAPGAGQSSNERLEFLGDSILGFISVEFLYRTFPELSEGVLSDMHTTLTKTETLATFARELELGKFLLVSKGEQSARGNQRILADTFEAVLGAIYLDQGIETVQRFLLPRLEPIAHEIVKKRSFKDNKTFFQELAQTHDRITPSYRLVSQNGPSHNREFTVEVLLGEKVVGRGQGKNKRVAEQEAAHFALLNRGWI